MQLHSNYFTDHPVSTRRASTQAEVHVETIRKAGHRIYAINYIQL